MTVLFEERPRVDPSVKDEFEGEFAFLDRVRSRFFGHVRTALNTWFGRYPEEEREELRTRLWSDDERASRAAFWELLLHELYTRAGFAATVHPEIDGTDRRPDFRLDRDGLSFLLEAWLATGVSEEQRKRDRRRRAVYRAVNKARPDNFHVRLSIARDGEREPPVAAIAKRLEAWLATLDPDAAAAALQRPSFDAAPRLPISVSGWELEFHALPLKAERRGGDSGAMLGVLPTETYVGQPSTTVRAALKRKGGRYGSPRLPLVVALAIEEPWLHDEDVESALYGQTFTRLGRALEVVATGRRDDGYWSPGRQSGRRVSAVLTARSVRPWFAAQVVPRLWLNPWADHPYDGPRLWAWTTPEDGTGFTHGPATTSAPELLGVSESWPPGDAFGPGDSDTEATPEGG